MLSSNFRKLIYFSLSLFALSYIHSFFWVDHTFLAKQKMQNDRYYDALLKNRPKKKKIREKISLNFASKEELTELPRIGPAMAQRIINYRNSTPFKRIEDLQNVKGIGEKTFESLKKLITL